MADLLCGDTTRLTLSPFQREHAVVYRPSRGGQAEDGVVTRVSADGSLAHVLYADQHPGAHAKATSVAMLSRP